METFLTCICLACCLMVCLMAGVVLRICLKAEQAAHRELPVSEEEQEAARAAAEAQRAYEQGFIDMMRYTGFEKKDGEW